MQRLFELIDTGPTRLHQLSRTLWALCVMFCIAALYSCQRQANAPRNQQVVNLELGVAVWTVGGLDAGSQIEFGTVVGAALGARRTTYVLDGAVHRITALDSAGRVVTAIGRSGRGPSEMLDPRQIQFSNETLQVLDSHNGIIELVMTDDAIQQAVATQLPFQASSFCTMHGRLYAFGLMSGNTIHEFTTAGKHLRSFGSTFGPDHNTLRQVISSEGLLACMPDSKVVVAMSTLLPTVRAFSSVTGRLLWEDTVKSFVPTMMQPIDDNRYWMGSGPDGHAVNRVLAVLTEDLLLAQSSRFSQAADENIVVTCVIEVRVGGCDSARVNLPLIISTHGNTAVTLREGIVPTIGLHALTVSTEQHGRSN